MHLCKEEDTTKLPRLCKHRSWWRHGLWGQNISNNSYPIAWIIKRLEKINWLPLLMLLWSVDQSFLHPSPRCRRVSWGPRRNGSPSLFPGGYRSWVHWLRYIWREQLFWRGETVNSDLFSSYLSCTVIATLLSYSKDLALNTLFAHRFWMLWNDTVLQKPDCISVGKCVSRQHLCSFKLQRRSFYNTLFQTI